MLICSQATLQTNNREHLITNRIILTTQLDFCLNELFFRVFSYLCNRSEPNGHIGRVGVDIAYDIILVKNRFSYCVLFPSFLLLKFFLQTFLHFLEYKFPFSYMGPEKKKIEKNRATRETVLALLGPQGRPFWPQLQNFSSGARMVGLERYRARTSQAL